MTLYLRLLVFYDLSPTGAIFPHGVLERIDWSYKAHVRGFSQNPVSCVDVDEVP